MRMRSVKPFEMREIYPCYVVRSIAADVNQCPCVAGRGTWRAEVLPPSRWDETRAPTWEIGQGVVWSFGPFLRAASLLHDTASA
jgi:hypothetical protein